MNTYYVKTDEQYSSTVEIQADHYITGNSSLDFYVRLDDGSTERVASFWNGRWNYVEKAVEVDYVE